MTAPSIISRLSGPLRPRANSWLTMLRMAPSAHAVTPPEGAALGLGLQDRNQRRRHLAVGRIRLAPERAEVSPDPPCRQTPGLAASIKP